MKFRFRKGFRLCWMNVCHIWRNGKLMIFHLHTRLFFHKIIWGNRLWEVMSVDFFTLIPLFFREVNFPKNNYESAL